MVLINKNLEHERANFAYNNIKDLMENKNYDDTFKKNYHSAVRSSGTLIQNSGLIQSLSYYVSKKSDKGISHYELLATHILCWLLEDNNNNILLDMYYKLLQKDIFEIMHYTDESKLFVSWLKRFSDSMFNSEI